MKCLSKIMVLLACMVILLHAFVPHHHHEGCGEVECFCHDKHNDNPSHHTDCCRLQEMLAHLIISTRDDEASLSAIINAEAHHSMFMIPVVIDDAVAILTVDRREELSAKPDSFPDTPCIACAILRGPPTVA